MPQVWSSPENKPGSQASRSRTQKGEDRTKCASPRPVLLRVWHQQELWNPKLPPSEGTHLLKQNTSERSVYTEYVGWLFTDPNCNLVCCRVAQVPVDVLRGRVWVCWVFLVCLLFCFFNTPIQHSNFVPNSPNKHLSSECKHSCIHFTHPRKTIDDTHLIVGRSLSSDLPCGTVYYPNTSAAE